MLPNKFVAMCMIEVYHPRDYCSSHEISIELHGSCVWWWAHVPVGVKCYPPKVGDPIEEKISPIISSYQPQCVMHIYANCINHMTSHPSHWSTRMEVGFQYKGTLFIWNWVLILVCIWDFGMDYGVIWKDRSWPWSCYCLKCNYAWYS